MTSENIQLNTSKEVINKIETNVNMSNVTKDILSNEFTVFKELINHFKNKNDIEMIMILREVNSVKIVDDVVEIVANENMLKQIYGSEHILRKLGNFFMEYNLSIKNYNEKSNNSTIQELIVWFDKKLQIK